MPSVDIDRLKEQGQRFLSGFTTGQKVVTGVALIAVIVAGYLFTQASSEASYSPLFSNLDPADASAITQKLNEKGVPYELQDGGQSISVPQDQVYQLRLDMSAEGLPGGGGGYALLDQQGITTSEFRQRIDYQRALQGEIAKTVQAMDGVQAASVHLVVPSQTVFATDTQKSTGSVLLRTDPDRPLSTGQTQAIVHLVASSVDGLDATSVTVADTSGRVLWAPGPNGGVASTDAGSGQTASYESDLSHDVQQMLDRVLGQGRSVVAVQASLDLDQRTTTSETYENPTTDPANPVPPLESTQSSEQLQGSTGAAGVLGTTGTPAAGGGQPSSYQKTETAAKNAVDKTVEQTQSTPGSVERQSVAVMLDAKHVDADRVAGLEQSIVAAAGIQFERGDEVTVERVPFDDTLARQARAELSASEQGGKDDSMFSYLRILLALVVIAVVLLLLWRAMKRGAERRPPRRVSLDLDQLDLSDPRALSTLPGFELPVGAAPIEVGARSEPDRVKGEISTLIDSQPEDVAVTLRSWLVERRP
jgi:flagellar M-ring protein FliF